MDLEITPIQAAHTAPPLGPFGGSSLRLRSHMLYIIGKLCPVLRKPPPWFKGRGFGSRFLIYKGIRIDRAHKGRGDNYDLRIRKQTGADSHVSEALSKVALPSRVTLQK